MGILIFIMFGIFLGLCLALIMVENNATTTNIAWTALFVLVVLLSSLITQSVNQEHTGTTATEEQRIDQ